jgi:hypothetical protein
MRYILAHDEARRLALEAVRQAPQGYVFRLDPPKRTLDQNSMIHPVVEKIARLLKRPTDKESLRQLRYLLLEQWQHETNRPPMFERSYDGQRWVSVNKGTSDLDKPDCSEFIEWMLSTESELTT